MSDAAPAAAIGPDVAAVLRSLGMRVASATRITGLPSRRLDRATYRIVLDDGRVVKARRVSRIEKAARFARLARGLALAGLPPVLAVDGRVVVEAWIDGTPLVDLPLSPDRIARAAALLGSLHAPGTDAEERAHVHVSTHALRRRARRHLGRLAAAGALERRAVCTLLDLVDRFAPAAAARGLTHNDLCAANLVEDAQGRLFVVDNEGLARGFLAFDLARTWYRWPMSRVAWTTFVERYAARCGAADALEAAPFWRIAAVARSANLRLVRYSAGAGIPIRRLRALAADGGCDRATSL